MFGNQTKLNRAISRHPEFATYLSTLGHFASDIAQDDRFDKITRMQILKYITAAGMLLDRSDM